MWLVVLGAAAGTAVTWWRQRQAGSDPTNPPEWPPIHETEAVAETSSTTLLPPPTEGTQSVSAPPTDTGHHTEHSPPTDVSALVNALVDTPDARSTSADGSWVPPNDDGSCPDGFPIKANDNSGIYHVPTGRFYARTKAERCYATAEGAVADGYRATKA